jgi:FMN phosphatase YigB (HAD superfamily)
MKLAVRAHALAHVLDQMPEGVRILSLDCFDTLLWRNMNAPADLFADLPLPGGGVEARGWGEMKARRVIPYLHDRDEVTLDEIYAELMPQASEAERAAAIQVELDAEAAHCYGFAPTRDLMAEAKRRGMRIIVVSDTYLTEPRLRALIAAAAGEGVAAMIDRIFCSCEHGMSKAGGLFVPVLAALGVSPGSIIHVGDNHVADQVAPTRLGIHTVHLKQFDEESEQRLRLEATAASIVDPATRVTHPAYQPHRAQIAMRAEDSETARLGHDVLGPLMHGWAGWLREEADALDAATGKTTKLLFLLRDGYLPAQAFLARYPDLADRCAMVEISRFTAGASGFTDVEAIRRYLLPELYVGNLEVFARQLLYPRDDVTRLGRMSKEKFARAVTDKGAVRRTVARSAEFADRLIAHLRGHGVEPGDSVMFVDLGYNGSVQNLCEPMLRDRMGLSIAGRYLLLRETTISGFDKKGFVDHRHHDLKLLHALSESIAIVEQLCTVAQGSVVDYRRDGSPVRKSPGMKDAQSAVRDAVQAACLDFCAHAGRGFVRPARSDTPEARRRMSVAILARLLFLPTAGEVAVLEDFAHDVNLGTSDVLKFVDVESAADGLRRRGLFYIKNVVRAYLAGELRQHGLPINLSVFASRRFGLDLRKSDFDVGALKLPVMLMDARGEPVVVEIDAVPTIEGWYQALIPVGAAQYTAGVQLGRLCDWVQIEEASFHEVEEFLKPKEREDGIDANGLLFEGMEEQAPGLYRCAAGEAAFLLVPPPSLSKGEPLLLSLVFRPVVRRGEERVAARAAA